MSFYIIEDYTEAYEDVLDAHLSHLLYGWDQEIDSNKRHYQPGWTTASEYTTRISRGADCYYE